MPRLLRRAAVAVAVLVAGALVAHFVAVRGRHVRVDDAFVTGQVVQILAPRAGSIDFVGVGRFGRVARGQQAFVIGERDVLSELDAAKRALSALMLEEAQRCFDRESQSARARIAMLGAQLARGRGEKSRALAAAGFYSARVAYEETEHYQITRDFLNSPERFFKTLFRGE